MDLNSADLLQTSRSLVKISYDERQRVGHFPRNQTQLLSMQNLQTLEEGLMLHHVIEQHDDFRETCIWIGNQVLLPRNQHYVVI